MDAPGAGGEANEAGDVSSLTEDMEELKITNSGTLPPNFVLCIGPPEDEPDGKVTEGSGTTNPSAAAARVVKEKLWKGRQVLKVCFMKPDDLKGCKSKEGKEMTTEMIMEWANVWSTTCPDVPQFVINEKEAKADIRVKFSDKDGNWSYIGMEAASIKAPKATMTLNLSGGYPESYLKHLVIHEFGHALGLEHEHQRSDFWDVVKEFIDMKKMKDDHRFKHMKGEKAGFGTNYLEKKTPTGECIESEYDPHSVMHYWFDRTWLKNSTYHIVQAIADSKLNPKQKRYLRGIHIRHNSYAFNPSPTDYEIIKKAYPP